MAGAEDTGIPRPTDAMVDVLIIGSGASGAAVAWGLAETRMKILCLEHLLGTARMGRDPEHSVVNEWGRSHDVKNLFIVDGSILVTCGGANPTSTIQALALYIADSIKKRLATLFD